MRIYVFSFFVAFTIISTDTLGLQGNSYSDDSSHWDYNDVDDWGNKFVLCKGEKQSPIDLITTGPDVVLRTILYLPPLELKGYDKKPKGMALTNNGHTAVLTMMHVNTVSGGYWSTEAYQLSQIHFHWGSNNSVGSEHKRNGKAYPIELHFLHYNNKYADLEEALTKKDGILVFAVWGEVIQFGNEPINSAIQNITSSLSKIQTVGVSTEITGDSIPELIHLLPNDTNVYYQYEGSLTTPNCKENVKWYIFDATIQISNSQMNEFRKLRQGGVNNELLVDNFRPVQAINERQLELVISSSNSPNLTWIILITCLLFHRFNKVIN